MIEPWWRVCSLYCKVRCRRPQIPLLMIIIVLNWGMRFCARPMCFFWFFLFLSFFALLKTRFRHVSRPHRNNDRTRRSTHMYTREFFVAWDASCEFVYFYNQSSNQIKVSVEHRVFYSSATICAAHRVYTRPADLYTHNIHNMST